MSAEHKHIDDLFREKQAETSNGNASSATYWSQLEQELPQQGPGPKKSFRKKITRRWITYMGLAALVTTVTYYAANRSSSSPKQKIAKAPLSPGAITPKLSIPLPAALIPKTKT